MILTYKEQEIQQRDQDGYVNLTQMAKANGVNINDWSKTQVTKSYIQALESETNIIASELLIINKGGIPNQQGT
jgi:histidinol phosphatase-like enzyme